MRKTQDREELGEIIGFYVKDNAKEDDEEQDSIADQVSNAREPNKVEDFGGDEDIPIGKNSRKGDEILEDVESDGGGS